MAHSPQRIRRDLGILGVAAGASGGATGWYNSLRSFDINKWQPRSGGRSPNPRFFSRPLLTSLDASGPARVLAGSSDRSMLDASSTQLTKLQDSSWRLPDSWLQHISSVSTIYTDEAVIAPEDRVSWAHTLLMESTRCVHEAEDILVDPSVLTTLTALDSGLMTFANDEGLV